MPTSTNEEYNVERVYEEIDELLKEFKGTDNLIPMGDWNVVVEKEKQEV